MVRARPDVSATVAGKAGCMGRNVFMRNSRFSIWSAWTVLAALARPEAQKKIIRWTNESSANQTAMSAEAAKLARLSFLVARINFVLTFPMLFFMTAASHYPILGRSCC